MRVIVVLILISACASAATLEPSLIAPTNPAIAPPLKAVAVDGTVYTLSESSDAAASGVVFLGTQCPISNKYLPDLNALAKSSRIFGVISDPTVTREAAAKYVAEYKIAFPILFDASGELARHFGPKVTPEAFVLDRHGQVKYRGQIDDSWTDLRRQKPVTTSHTFADALASVAAGRAPATAQAPATGCFFEAWDSQPKNAPVTYARDVAPIFNAHCVQCHRPGEVAPFSLTSYDEAAKHAKQITRVTNERLMPPWKAEPGFGHFADERRLSDSEIALLSAWANGGAAKGNDADLPPLPKFASGWALGEPDVVVAMPQPFHVPASGRDIYRVFPIPVNVPEDKYVVGFEFKPAATTVVHHALIFLDNKGLARAKAAENTDGQPGYRSFGGLGFQPSGGLGGWAPGAMPFFQPEGVGRPLRKGSDIVLQIHYHPDGKEHDDQSKLAIYFAKKPIQQMSISIPVRNRDIDIAPGDSHYVRTASITAPRDVTLYGIIPHMHLVGRQMKVTAKKPDGIEIPLIRIKDWDFRWQDQYRYLQPVKLPKGTVVTLEAIYDNSSANPDNPNNPPKRVLRGEQTTDEMCLCFLQLTVDDWYLSSPKSLATGLEILRWYRDANRGTTQPTK